MLDVRSHANTRKLNGPVINAHLMRVTPDAMYIHPHQRLLGP